MVMQCAAEACDKQATLRCPTCVKTRYVDPAASFFCSRDCFQASWTQHKKLHAKPDMGIRALPTSDRLRMAAFDGYSYTGQLRVASVHMPMRTVPDHIPRPDYATDGFPKSEERFNRTSTSFRILDQAGVDGMRKVCALAREVLDIAVRAADVGVTTEEIDRVVHEACVERESYPSPLNYYGFPKSCCTSVNEVICHGIPDMRPLQDGDILNIDITLYHGGFHGDVNETICIGSVDRKKRKLVKAAYDSMWAAIKAVKPGVLFRDFGPLIDKTAKKENVSVVRSYCGHGINEEFHTAPNVPHYRKNKAVGMCKKGMTFTIEPMLNAGSWRDDLWPDNWTSVTADGMPSAQFEHTLLVTENGFEVLTDRVQDGPIFWWEKSDTGIK